MFAKPKSFPHCWAEFYLNTRPIAFISATFLF